MLRKPKCSRWDRSRLETVVTRWKKRSKKKTVMTRVNLDHGKVARMLRLMMRKTSLGRRKR